MTNVWVVLEHANYDSDTILAIYKTEEEANKLVELIKKINENRITDDGHLLSPFNNNGHSVEAHTIDETPQQLVDREMAAARIQVEKIRAIHASPEYKELERKRRAVIAEMEANRVKSLTQMKEYHSSKQALVDSAKD